MANVDKLATVTDRMRRALADADRRGLTGPERDQHVVTTVQNDKPRR